MQKELATNLRVGLLIVAALVLFVVFIFGVGGGRSLFEKRYIVRTRFNNTAGLTEGAVVRLSGVRIGMVSAIRFPEDVNAKSIVVDMEVTREGMERLSPDSTATIKTEGLLGDKYIEIVRGNEPPLENLPSVIEIKSYSYPEFDKLLGESEELIENIVAISKSLNELVGTFKEHETVDNLSRTIASLRRTVEEVEKGDGLVHQLIYGDGAREGVGGLEEAISNLNTVLRRINEGGGVLHTLLYDEEFDRSLERSVKNLDRTMELLAADDGVAVELAEAVHNLRVITEKLEGGEGTLGALLNDPTLYDRITGLVGQAERSRFVRAAIRYMLEERKRRQER